MKNYLPHFALKLKHLTVVEIPCSSCLFQLYACQCLREKEMRKEGKWEMVELRPESWRGSQGTKDGRLLLCGLSDLLRILLHLLYWQPQRLQRIRGCEGNTISCWSCRRYCRLPGGQEKKLWLDLRTSRYWHNCNETYRQSCCKYRISWYLFLSFFPGPILSRNSSNIEALNPSMCLHSWIYTHWKCILYCFEDNEWEYIVRKSHDKPIILPFKI